MLALYSEIKQRAVKKIDSIIQRGNLDGSWATTDTDELARSLHSLLVGEIIKLLIEPQVESSEDIFRRIQNIYLKIVNADLKK